MHDFFPPLEPYNKGFLKVSDIHTLYWEECGNPEGRPVIFLHGGPGGGVAPDHRRFFDPQSYRIILLIKEDLDNPLPVLNFVKTQLGIS